MAATPPIDEPWNHYRGSTSGGSGSAAPRADLDWEGRRFLACAGVAGEHDAAPDAGPVRVFVGTEHGHDAASRAALALDELERLCEAAPALLVIGAPTGTGYVDTSALWAAEQLAGGRCATVTVQFGTLRSGASTGALEVARQHLTALLGELRERALGGWRPDRVLVWAESFGAWTLAAGLVERPSLLDDVRLPLSVAWVGVPGPMLADHDLRAAMEQRVPHERRWLDGDDVSADSTGDVMLMHVDDPVTHVEGWKLALRPQRHVVPGTKLRDRMYRRGWLPLRTALRARADIDRVTLPGGPDGLRRVHDYRYAAPHLVAAALGLGRASDAVVQAVADAERSTHGAFDQLGPDPTRANPWRSGDEPALMQRQ